ncbi:hypothetical protein Lal_00049597 [Lupinus albus]|uniref:Putative transcription regulator mTERF family n=1 Tax=Lupinus albus TaxID=3870 RepID=A0A6A5M3S3_LUPAL|nr:putative transcription regulator mTERF family [Lupinus albus]KAF1867168.1 hypothetical protein Lal_00049597 [Lupinus albus]
MSIMLNSHRFRSILYLTHLSLSPIPKSQCYLHPSPLTLNFFSTASNHKAFTVPYLISNFGFSPEIALKTSKRVHFDNPQKPDSVIAFLKTHGFSDTQISSVMRRAPELLTCDPIKRVLPKFQFLISKGASPSDVVATVSRSPAFLRKSLDNHIIPAFELVRRFSPSDERAIACVIASPTSISDARVQHNVNMLIDEGVTHSSIYHLFRTRPTVLCSNDLEKVLDEVKKMGFNPSKTNFSVAILAKKAITKAQWDAKIDAFKTWGWSEKEILEAFKRLPQFMLRSPDKLNAVISFWVGQLGWDPSTLLRAPVIFGYSLEKRLIPRASVVKELLSKGLMRKNANLVTPFGLSEHMFLEKFVRCLDEENASGLLKLYQKELQQVSVD